MQICPKYRESNYIETRGAAAKNSKIKREDSDNDDKKPKSILK
jgi:hypothetical protein